MIAVSSDVTATSLKQHRYNLVLKKPNVQRVYNSINGRAQTTKPSNICRLNWLALLSQMVSELFKEILEGNRKGNNDKPNVSTTMITQHELAIMAQ